MSEITDNPAARLLIVLERGLSREILTKPSIAGWADVLGLRTDDVPQLLRGIANVAMLAKDIETAIINLGTLNHKHYLAWVPKFLTPYQNFNLQSHMSHFFGVVDETMLALLRICDDQLHKGAPEPTVSKDDLVKLNDSVRDLAAEIAKSEFEPEFKAYLMRFVHSIENALRDYKLKGFEALRSGLEQSIGIYALSKAKIESNQETAVGKKLIYLLGIYASILAAASSTLKLGKDIILMLPDETSNVSQATPTK